MQEEVQEAKQYSENNKRIAKNSAMLYVRMLLTMFITLYISRIILQNLGTENFGIYNVVGGMITLFSFINSALTTATQRFLSFELGKKGSNKIAEVFSTSILVHFVIGAVVFIGAETIGLWFLNTHLNIPESKIQSAIWVLHATALTSVITVLSVPYNSLIVAHERMGVFAYFSILDVFIKLIIAFSIAYFNNTLRAYAVLILFSQITNRLLIGLYCRRKFKESKFKFTYNKKLFRNILSFAGWSVYGNLTNVLYQQGMNILVNIFFGPFVNAGRAIALQISNSITSFVTNFQTAVNPQLIKTYSNKNLENMKALFYMSSKYSFVILLLVSLPALFELHLILKLWLVDIPPYAFEFSELMIINALINTLANPISVAVQATGNIKKYQFYVGTIMLLNPLIGYSMYKVGLPPQAAVYGSIIISITLIFVRIYLLDKILKFGVREYIQKIIVKVTIISTTSVLAPLVITSVMKESILRLLLTVIITIMSIVISTYFLGTTKEERNFINTTLHIIFKRYKQYVSRKGHFRTR